MSIPNVIMDSATLKKSTIVTPENEKLDVLGLDFGLNFEHPSTDQLIVNITADISRIDSEGTKSEPFLSITYEGEFTRDTAIDKLTEEFIAANMLYPSLRNYAIQTLSQMHIDGSDFPLSVPARAIINQHQ